MLSDVDYNSARGNRYYETCTSSCVENTSNGNIRTVLNHNVGGGSGHGDSNWQGPGNTFEAWDFRKGDVARAMFYMDVRYEGLGEVDTTGTAEPDLILTNNAALIQTSTGGTAYMGILSTLIQWHIQDPVDAIEEERNEVVFSYQGNRNPFVDHPDWVDCIFAGGVCTTTVPDEFFSNGFE
jgi:endonuclease I